jgi:NitT/TauT family transport system permease protein
VGSLAETPGLFVGAGLRTLGTFATGWAIGAAVGLALGAGLALLPRVRPVAYPYLVALRVVPQVAVAPLLLIWFGISFESAVIVVAASTFFPVTVGAAVGLSSVPSEHRALLRSVDASGWRPFVAVRLRHALPSLFAGLKLSTVSGLAGTVVAEWFVAHGGLGVLVLQGMTDFVPSLTYAAAVALFVLGGGLFLAVSAVGRALSW